MCVWTHLDCCHVAKSALAKLQLPSDEGRRGDEREGEEQHLRAAEALNRTTICENNRLRALNLPEVVAVCQAVVAAVDSRVASLGSDPDSLHPRPALRVEHVRGGCSGVAADVKPSPSCGRLHLQFPSAEGSQAAHDTAAGMHLRLCPNHLKFFVGAGAHHTAAPSCACLVALSHVCGSRMAHFHFISFHRVPFYPASTSDVGHMPQASAATAR